MDAGAVLSRHLLVIATAAGIGACASAPPDPNRPIEPACNQSASCFYEHDIRSFRVLDDRSVIVLVGRNECPFRVEVDGFFCNLGLSSYLAFNDRDGRICSWDRSYVAGDPFMREEEYCRVRQVTPLTDDELLEAYAIDGIVAPLPARGSGELEVAGEDTAAPSPAEVDETSPDAATPQASAEPLAVVP